MRKQRIAVFFSALQILFIVVLLAIVTLSFGTRIPWLANLGFNFFTVTSGSMEPTIPVGSVIHTGRYQLDDLKAGDIITYSLTGDDGQSAVVTHRIHEITKNEEERQIGDETRVVTSYEIKTKGDANAEPDNYMLGQQNVIGLYQWHLPGVGYLVSFIQSPAGFVLFIVIPGLILIIWEIISLFWHFKKKSDTKKDQEIERLKQELAKKESK